MKRLLLVELVTFIFIALFVYSGLNKLMDMRLFKDQIEMSPLLEPVSGLVSVVVPVVELIIPVILVMPKVRLIGTVLCLVLMLAFNAYIFYILTSNRDIPCSCGGALEMLSWKDHILLNSCLAFISGASIAIQVKVKRLGNLKAESTQSLMAQNVK